MFERPSRTSGVGQILEDVKTDAVAVHDDQGGLVQLALLDNHRAHIGQFDARSDDRAEKIQNILAAAVLRQAELRANGPVAAALRRREVPRMNDQFERRYVAVARQAVDGANAGAAKLRIW